MLHSAPLSAALSALLPAGSAKTADLLRVFDCQRLHVASPQVSTLASVLLAPEGLGAHQPHWFYEAAIAITPALVQSVRLGCFFFSPMEQAACPLSKLGPRLHGRPRTDKFVSFKSVALADALLRSVFGELRLPAQDPDQDPAQDPLDPATAAAKRAAQALRDHLCSHIVPLLGLQLSDNQQAHLCVQLRHEVIALGDAPPAGDLVRDLYAQQIFQACRHNRAGRALTHALVHCALEVELLDDPPEDRDQAYRLRAEQWKELTGRPFDLCDPDWLKQRAHAREQALAPQPRACKRPRAL